MKNRTLFLASILALLAGACRETPPPPPPDLPRFTVYYASELFLVERTRLSGGSGDGLEAGLDSLRKAYGFSAGRRDSLLSHLKDSLPRWEAFLKDVLLRLEEKGEPGRRDSVETDPPVR